MSGGADSTALALLAAAWARARGGQVLALIVDHGLRAAAEAEASATARLLNTLGIPAQILTLRALPATQPIAAAAREARYRVLVAAARAAAIVHLLVGHHAGDQAETVLMRSAAGSGAAGLAGMASLRELPDIRLLRPLLDVPPERLIALLRARAIPWIEDPSNADLRTLRARLRLDLSRGTQHGLALQAEAHEAATARVIRDRSVAAELADRASLSPLGYALLSPGPIGPAALAALWQAISGRAYPPPLRAIAALAAAPRPATLAGARLAPAGRLGPGWLLIRDAPPPPDLAAAHGAAWDRFRLHAPNLPPSLTIGAAGHAAPARDLPALIRTALPALKQHGRVIAIPHLAIAPDDLPPARFQFAPPVPASAAPFSLPFRDA